MLSALKFLFKYQQKLINRSMFYVSLLCLLLVLFHTGYNTNPSISAVFEEVIRWSFYLLLFLTGGSTLLSIYFNRKVNPEHIPALGLLGYFLIVALARNAGAGFLDVAKQAEWMYFAVFAVFLIELSKSSLFFDNFYFNPTILFVISFLCLVFIGAFLLMLPKSVHGDPIRFVDALFMATSAVCITGLSVVDVASRFSDFGQLVILILIQLGGLGIMTFTGFFGYFFSGGFSFKNQLMYGEVLGENKVGSVIRTLFKIIFITLLFEAVGAVLIFFTTSSSGFDSTSERMSFAIFHAISAFCNAGFTNIVGGFQQDEFRFNYPMQLVLSLLFILGGLGFSLVFGFYAFIKRWAVNIYWKIRSGKAFRYRARSMDFNTRLITYMAAILIVFSTLITFLLEYDGVLAAHQTFWGKLVASFFTGNSSRTSGFSIDDIGEFSFPLVLVMMVLMWIGASPGSTGGGIKTTTFAIAMLNVFRLAQGKSHSEIFKRKISGGSVNKAFAIIVLSFLGIGMAIFALTITDGDQAFSALAFEAFSAYATCGLSLGITPSLSDAGKIVITLTMFVGRVGMLTLLVAFIRNIKNRNYTYPEEKVLF